MRRIISRLRTRRIDFAAFVDLLRFLSAKVLDRGRLYPPILRGATRSTRGAEARLRLRPPDQDFINRNAQRQTEER